VEQPTLPPWRRILGDQLGGQLEVEVAGEHTPQARSGS
jgi:hypothetical protein